MIEQMNSTFYLKEQLKEMEGIQSNLLLNEAKEHALVIGFAGKDKVGKTTLAVQTQHMLGEKTHLCSFAEEIRETITNTFVDFLVRTHIDIFGSGIETPVFDKDSWLIDNKDLAREMMRTFGTQTIRKHISNNYWVLLSQYKYFYKNAQNPYEHSYLFHDVRYLNELEWIRSFKNNAVFYLCDEKERRSVSSFDAERLEGLITRRDVNPAEIIWDPKGTENPGLKVVASYLTKINMIKPKKDRVIETVESFK